MYPFSNNSNNLNNPIAYTMQGTPHMPSSNNDNSCFNFHLHSPYMHYEDEALLFQDLHNLDLHQHHLSPTPENGIFYRDKHTPDLSQKNDPNDNPKKASKKDRHSKIITAHGLRDRRMRLSLEVARKFFDLQDLLGFDKPSKTVEWLLKKSISSIKELSNSTSISSTNSECEVISSSLMDESAATNENQNAQENNPSTQKQKTKKIKIPSRRIPIFHPLAKKSREKARERARERTKEKTRRLQQMNESGNQEHENHNLEGGSNINIIGNDSLGVTGNWSPSTIFSFQESSAVSTNGLQFADVQFCGKSWEDYSNMNL